MKGYTNLDREDPYLYLPNTLETLNLDNKIIVFYAYSIFVSLSELEASINPKEGLQNRPPHGRFWIVTFAQLLKNCSLALVPFINSN